MAKIMVSSQRHWIMSNYIVLVIVDDLVKSGWKKVHKEAILYHENKNHM